MIAPLVLGIAAGFSPFLPLVVLGVAARSGLEPGLRQGFGFLSQWAVLGPLLLLVGVELVLDKLPATSPAMTRAGWAVRPAAGAIATAAPVSAAIPFPFAVLLGAALAGIIYWLRCRLIRRLGRRLFGLERLSVGAYGELASVIVSLFAILLPWVGLGLAGIALAITFYSSWHFADKAG